MLAQPTQRTQRDPLHDWRVRARPPWVAADAALTWVLPLVGREGLLLEFEAQVGRALAGEVVVLALAGEPGIGKTRVLRAFAERGRAHGLEVAWADGGTCDPGPRPATPLLVLCDGERAVASLKEPNLQGRVNVACEEVKHGCLVVITYSPADVEGQVGCQLHAWLAAAARQCELIELDLPPLSDPELAELIEHAASGPPDPELLHILSSLSEGNPYFALQTFVDLTRTGVVAANGPTWSLRGCVPADYVPPAIASLAAHQISTLDRATAITLASAAVVGAGFQFDLLATICAASSDDEVLRHLERGVESGIIHEATEPPDDFQFAHELTRRSLYRRLSTIRRRQLHQAVARAIEAGQTGADLRDPDRAAVLAHHYGRGRDPHRAFEHTLRALEQAESVAAWDDAIQRCREAIDFARLADRDEQVELRLLIHLGGLYFGRAQTFAAGTCWREALRICDSAGDLHTRAILMAHLAALGPAWQSIGAAEEAVAAAEAAPEPAASLVDRVAGWPSDAYMNLGLAKERYGRLPEAMTFLRHAVELSRRSDPWTRGLVLGNLGSALAKSGQPTEAVSVLRAAIELLERPRPLDSGDMPLEHLRDPRRARCLALADLARCLAIAGDLDEALELAERAHVEEERLAIRPRRSHRAIAQIELRRGRPGAALEALARAGAYTATELLGSHRVADLLLMAVAQLAAGDAAAALRTARDGMRICERSGTREYLARLYVAAGRALLAQGDLAGASEATEHAAQAIEATGTRIDRPDVLRLKAAIRRRVTQTSAEDGPATRTGCAGAATRRLSRRELEVLALVANGQSNRSIAQSLIVSDKTIKRHLSNILDKLGVSTRAAAVSQGLRLGML